MLIVEQPNATPDGIVLYTDGGCRPARGIGGYGVHGYSYKNDLPKQGSGCKGGVLTSAGYKDAGEAVKGKQAVVTPIDYFDYWGSLIPESTNNEAELRAAIVAMNIIESQGIKEALLLMDSQYVLKGLTEWVHGWRRNGWVKADGLPVANKDHWLELLAVRDRLEKELAVTIRMAWVEGHSGNLGNDMADMLATRGVIVGRKGKPHVASDITPAKGYWTSKNEYNRMISQTRWYFNSNANMPYKNGRTVYHLGEHRGGEDEYGKKISDNTFSVVLLKEPNLVMEKVRSFQNHIHDGTGSDIVVGRLDTILSPSVYPMVEKHGDLLLHSPTRKLDIYTSEDAQLTEVKNPPHLALTIVELLNVLESKLFDYLEDASGPLLTVTDLTDLLFDVKETKNKKVVKLKSEIGTGTRSINVQAKYDVKEQQGVAEVSLTIGIDTPSRNTLAALAERDPTVQLVTWRESEKAFRYATIVTAGDDVGIWAGIYSNLRMML